eukprot:Ihof_evm11s46 gene=Ihof_evmTU11s46
MDHESRKIRIACCQFSPILGEVEKNIAKVESLMINFNPGDADLLVLPELAFSGYSFQDKESIAPYVENPQTGPSVTWAKTTAVKLKTHVIIGYPRLEPGTGKNADKYYNSVAFVAPDGTIIKTYDKHFLYDKEELWAEEGPGFWAIDTDAFGKIGIGICMDLNPRQFKAPFDAYEWATFMAEERVDIAVLVAAWLDPNTETEDALQTPNYWIHRLVPLLNTDTILVVCNRTGSENKTTFSGCSCVMSLKHPMLLGQLNKRQENILLVDVNHKPRVNDRNK